MSTPTINVNLMKCNRDCQGVAHHLPPGGHWAECAAYPVNIPCPLPRSVIFTMRLGRCSCPYGNGIGTVHDGWCHGRHIHVSCSIRGETWAESEVARCAPVETAIGGWVLDGWFSAPREHTQAITACRELWAVVKALVLGKDEVDSTDEEILRAWDRLFSQRDTVYAEIAEMARAEGNAALAQARVLDALRWSWVNYGNCPGHSPTLDARRPSVVLLGRYVERLIEQVGALS